MTLLLQFNKILRKSVLQKSWQQQTKWRRLLSADNSCKPKSIKGLVLGVYEREGDKSPRFTTSGEKFDDALNGKVSELVKEYNINGKLGVGKILQNVDPEFRSVAVVGLGKENAGFNEIEMIDEGMENVRIAAAVGARGLQYQGCTDIFVDTMEYAEQAAEGSALAIWRYYDNRTESFRLQIPKLEVFNSPEVDAWTRGLFKAEAQNLARRLTDAPANQMTPQAFAQAAVDALCPCGVNVQIRNIDWIEQNRLNSFLTVAKGSCEPPLILEINYTGTAPEDKPVLLFGKGLTFNSGGLCLRDCKGMHEYRGSMAGAAVIVGAIRAAAALSLPINVAGFIPLCENLPSGMAVKCGDVIKLLNGKTMAVRNPDKAGVVVMADPLLFAQNTFKPRLLVDLATLGNGVTKGLCSSAAGIFSNSQFIFEEFEKAGAISGDRVWRLPLWNYFKKLIKNNSTFDLSNDGEGHIYIKKKIKKNNSRLS